MAIGVSVITFDSRTLEQSLDSLSGQQRALFALSCAERLYPAYSRHPKHNAGELDAARQALDQMWNKLKSTNEVDRIEYAQLAENYLRGEDAEWHPLNPIADNAIASVIYAAQCVDTGDSESAKWAAVQAYEAADYVAHTLASIVFGSRHSESAIAQSSVIQGELKLQQEIMQTLKDTPSSVAQVDALKSRSKEAGELFAGQAIAITNRK